MNRAAVLAWRKPERARILAARQSLPLEGHKAASEAVWRTVEAHFSDRLAGRLVGAYWPFRRELDPRPLLGRLGASIALPVVTAPATPLSFRAWTPDTPMARGVWDIPYPAEGPFVTPDILLVPLLGFDGARYRLGYGGGYYDRTLASAPRPFTIGVGLEVGRLETIHPLPHDIRLDAIATEAGLG